MIFYWFTSLFSSFRYVAEMMENRILRFFQQPAGVFHGSVFYQMSGSVGPSSIALDSTGSLYIGQYDVKGMHNYFFNVFNWHK